MHLDPMQVSLGIQHYSKFLKYLKMQMVLYRL